jgi:COMPASS component SWD3
MTDILECYQILGLQYGASIEEIEKAYRRLVKAHHPDLFPYDYLLKKEAEEKLKKINIAHEALLVYQPVDRDLNRQNNRQQTNSHNVCIDNREANAKKCYNLGVIEVERGNKKEAIEYFSSAIRLNPNYLEAYQYRGFLREQMGLDLSARADFQKVWQLRREDLNNRYPSKITPKSNRSQSPSHSRPNYQKNNFWQTITRYIRKIIRSIKSIFSR